MKVPLDRVIERWFTDSAVPYKRQLFGVAFGALTTYSFTFIVWPGQVALEWQVIRGVRDDLIHNPGLHFKIPYFSKPIFFDAFPPPQDGVMTQTTSDGKKMDIEVRLHYHPRLTRLATLYNRLGKNYTERLFPEAFQLTVKQAIGSKTTDEVAKALADGTLQQELRTGMFERLGLYYVILDELELVSLRAPSWQKTTATESNSVGDGVQAST